VQNTGTVHVLWGENSDILPRVARRRSSLIFIRYYERGEEEKKVVVLEGGS